MAKRYVLKWKDDSTYVWTFQGNAPSFTHGIRNALVLEKYPEHYENHKYVAIEEVEVKFILIRTATGEYYGDEGKLVERLEDAKFFETSEEAWEISMANLNLSAPRAVYTEAKMGGLRLK